MKRDATRWGRPVYRRDRYGARFSGMTGTGRPTRKRRPPGWKRGERRAMAQARLRLHEMKMAAR